MAFLSDFNIFGFAQVAGVTGGGTGPNDPTTNHIIVTSLNDTGAGTLRAALNTSGKRYITFDPALNGGYINFAGSSCTVAYGNFTLDGAGSTVKIGGLSTNDPANTTNTATASHNGYSLCLYTGTPGPISNWIIKNCEFAYSLAGRAAINVWYGSYNGWIDHCLFHDNSTNDAATGEPISYYSMGGEDGLTGLTCSWCRFDTPNIKSILLGSNFKPGINNTTTPYNARLSIHHCWFNGSDWRQPRVHSNGMTAHCWNNLHTGWMAGSAAAEISHQGYFLDQNSIYEIATAGQLAISGNIYSGTNLATATNQTGCIFKNTSGGSVPGVVSVGTFPMSRITYTPTLEAPDDTMKARIMAGAGANKSAVAPVSTRIVSLGGIPLVQ
jgi:pectate lyase